MQLEIISPDKTIFAGETEYVQLSGSNGSFGLLKNHAPMIATLKAGKVKVVAEDKSEQLFDIKGGVVEVLNNKIIVLSES